MFDLFKRRRRQLARERAQRRREYRQRVALGEPALRAAQTLDLLEPASPPTWKPDPPERTLAVIEGGQGDPQRQGAIYVFGANGYHREEIA